MGTLVFHSSSPMNKHKFAAIFISFKVSLSIGFNEHWKDFYKDLTFIYGDQDWMDPKAAKRLLNRVRDARQRKLVESDLKVLTTVSAGHYPFLDQPGAFLMNILDTCGCYLSHEARKKIERIAQEYPVLSLPAMDTEEQLRKEFAKDPATAEVHIASDL